MRMQRPPTSARWLCSIRKLWSRVADFRPNARSIRNCRGQRHVVEMLAAPKLSTGGHLRASALRHSHSPAAPVLAKAFGVVPRLRHDGRSFHYAWFDSLVNVFEINVDSFAGFN